MEYRQEKKIEQALCAKVKASGGVALKIVSPGFAGVPDRLVLRKGRANFVELKAPGQKPTPRQLAVHRLFAKWGFPVRIIDSLAAVDAFVWWLEEGDAS
ncbi:MAG: VRR-NUC domain-containing protein [Peptococcaceae bacterium]|nr:VRR-NUC domain-containing protein [Peptococcaceae bacterium]